MSHLSAISPCRVAAATAAIAMLFSSCSDLTVPPEQFYGISDLIVLAQRQNAPAPASRSFWIFNSSSSIVRILHPDNFNSLYLELSFPAFSMSSLNGTPLSATDSLYVTVDTRPGAYGFTMSPSGISFVPGSAPTAAFSFSVYGDATVGTASGSYGSTSQYVTALDIWREVSVDQWQISPGSGSTGLDAVGADIETSGRFVLAAPR